MIKIIIKFSYFEKKILKIINEEYYLIHFNKFKFSKLNLGFK